METARKERVRTLIDLRRALFLDAARAVFAESGIEGASIREIAKRAGYTPGAIYSYFESKEAIYGALLSESLARLNDTVRHAVEQADTPLARLLRSAQAWFDFYARNPRDLDLGFYLVQGLAQRGLTKELNRKLNAELRNALLPGEHALAELGLAPAEATAESAALFAHGVGLLLLQHTGRIRIFGQDCAALFGRYLEQLAQRAAPRATKRLRETRHAARR